MAVFVNDTFTGTDNTDLESRTGETGATWTKHSTTASGNMRLGADGTSNKVCSTVSASSMYYPSGSPATAEYDVQADLTRVGATGSNIGYLCARIDTGNNTYYAAGADLTSGLWVIRKVVAGVATNIVTTAITWANGDTKTLKFEVRDATKKLFVDGTEVLSTTNNDITAAGKPGFRTSGYSASLSYFRYDNFTATDAAAGGGGATTAISATTANAVGSVSSKPVPRTAISATLANALGAVVSFSGSSSTTISATTANAVGAVSSTGSTANGTFTSEVLKDYAGNVLASVALNYVRFYNDTTGALVLSKTGISTNASGIVTFSDAALVAGQTYRVDWETAAGSRRMPRKAAT